MNVILILMLAHTDIKVVHTVDQILVVEVVVIDFITFMIIIGLSIPIVLLCWPFNIKETQQNVYPPYKQRDNYYE